VKKDFKELMLAINQVCHERQLPIDIVLEAVEVALISAYKRNYVGHHSITAQLDPKTGKMTILTEKLVVDTVEDERNEISLPQARAINPRIKVGEIVSIDSTPEGDFGRIAAQTAKQVILQRIREAERDALFNSYAEREGEIVNGTVHKIDSHQVTLSLGKVEAYLPRNEQIPTERYSEGQRLRAYVASVAKANRGPQIIVSRTHRNMLRRLLEVEVPEIYNGTVEIKSIAREAGYRSKVAVAALQEGVDPVGSCVGMRGTRIQSIVNELNGEKIDVVQWNPDVSYFIANSLSPAKVMNVALSDEKGKTAAVVVPDKQLSLAIGKEGQNARLAAKLTGWRIDIKSASEAISETLDRLREDKALRERMSSRSEIFNLAASIAKTKDPLEYSDAELNVLSQAIEAVNLADMAMKREYKVKQAAEAEAARAAGKSRDLLAEAEAILTGKAAPTDEVIVSEFDETGEQRETAPEIEGEPLEIMAAEELAETPVTADAEELQSEPVVVDDLIAAAELLLAETASPEEGAAPTGEVWSDEDLDDEETRKKKAQKKKRNLVFDEKLGQVVTDRRRKPNRRGWLDFGEDEE
jgi:transcription termination/antitermination protein NusA